jgi:copper(I)-binding protein
MNRRVLGAAMLAVLAVLAVACSGASATSSAPPPIDTSDIHVFSAAVTPGPDGTAVVALALHNAATKPDRLVRVSCTCATSAQILDAPAAGVVLAPDKIVILGPGGPRIVLSGLTAPLSPGGTATIELTFAKAAPTTTVAEVKTG